jgi:hypothetical protein
MNDPHPQPGVIPARPATIPQQPHAQPQFHPQQAPQVPGAARPLTRPAVAPQQHVPQAHPQQHAPQHQPQQLPQHHAQPGGPAKIAAMPTLAAGIPVGDEGAIELIEDGDEAQVLHKKIKAFGPENTVKQTKWTRQPLATGGTGAVRVKTFHCKLSDQGIEYLDDAINHFIDAHPEVNVKFVTSNIGMFDGKFKDFALVINVWY